MPRAKRPAERTPKVTPGKRPRESDTNSDIKVHHAKRQRRDDLELASVNADLVQVQIPAILPPSTPPRVITHSSPVPNPVTPTPARRYVDRRHLWQPPSPTGTTPPRIDSARARRTPTSALITSVRTPAPSAPPPIAIGTPVTTMLTTTSVPYKIYKVPLQSQTQVLSAPLIQTPSVGHAGSASVSIPSLRSIVGEVTPITISKPTHLPWSELPEVTRRRLTTRYNSLVTLGLDHYRHRLYDHLEWPSWPQFTGLWSCEESDSIPTDDRVFRFMWNDVDSVTPDGLIFYEFCHHPRFINNLDVLIDEALAELEPLLIPSAILHPSSHSRSSAYTDRDPLSVGQLATPWPLTSVRVWGTFMERRPPKIKEPKRQTLELMRGVSAYWGFYFSYSPNQTAEEARESKSSQDLILAVQHLGAVVDTASLHAQATPRHAELAERYFDALYLTRILVFSAFLDSLPKHMRMAIARAEWAVFQRDPPRMPSGEDVFAMVYRHIAGWHGPTMNLKRTAEARFTALVKRNHRYFARETDPREARPPFYLVVDEIEAPVLQSPSSGRRPACSRRGVSALFYGFDGDS